jgi:hypothetical protein
MLLAGSASPFCPNPWLALRHHRNCRLSQAGRMRFHYRPEPFPKPAACGLFSLKEKLCNGSYICDASPTKHTIAVTMRLCVSVRCPIWRNFKVTYENRAEVCASREISRPGGRNGLGPVHIRRRGNPGLRIPRSGRTDTPGPTCSAQTHAPPNTSTYPSSGTTSGSPSRSTQIRHDDPLVLAPQPTPHGDFSGYTPITGWTNRVSEASKPGQRR